MAWARYRAVRGGSLCPVATEIIISVPESRLCTGYWRIYDTVLCGDKYIDCVTCCSSNLLLTCIVLHCDRVQVSYSVRHLGAIYMRYMPCRTRVLLGRDWSYE